MSKKELNTIVNKIYEYIKTNKENCKGITKKAILLYMECQKVGNYKLIHETKLYNCYGGNYCYMIEIINRFMKL